MIAKNVMMRGTASILPNATVLEAAELMVNVGLGALPVVDGQGCLVGIVSEADVIPDVTLDAPPQSGSSSSHHVSDVMTKDVVSVSEETSLKSAIELMVSKRLKVVPVVRGSIVVGMLGRQEIMRLIASKAIGDPSVATRVSDDTVRRGVLEAVKGHRWSLAQRFDVIVKDGAVHLWGVVPSENVHASYREAAEKVPQALSVVSHMHVMPHGVRMSNMY